MLLLLLALLSCSSAPTSAPAPVAEPSSAQPVANALHAPTGTPVKPFTYKGRTVNPGPYPPIASDGNPSARLDWLFALPFEGTKRLKQAVDDHQVHVVLDSKVGVAAFRGSTTEEIAAGMPPYAMSIGPKMLSDDRSLLDLMAAVSHEGIHVHQCLDEGRCPSDDITSPSTMCAAKWKREFEGYRESCMVIMSTGRRQEQVNCADDSAIAILTYNAMIGTGQVASFPECGQLWLDKYGP